MTPTNCAVRLETGSVDLQLSNRVQNVSGPVPSNTNMKLFIKATVDVNLSLGQVIKHAIFEEADAEFQQFAFFKTRIGEGFLVFQAFFGVGYIICQFFFDFSLFSFSFN